MSDEINYNLIRKISETPELPQRQLAEQLGCSLGKINYCIKALVNKGLVKVENFCSSDSKRVYAYKLTPAGLKAKALLTLRFLRQKEAEYEKLRNEIEQLKSELNTQEETA
jgi:EPS-associated MarR family transcriptional regulator